MIDRYTKIVLTVIALALSVLAVRPVLEPQRAEAQRSGEPVEVKIVGTTFGALMYALPNALDIRCVEGCGGLAAPPRR